MAGADRIRPNRLLLLLALLGVILLLMVVLAVATFVF